jgi:hypothetical protein
MIVYIYVQTTPSPDRGTMGSRVRTRKFGDVMDAKTMAIVQCRFDDAIPAVIAPLMIARCQISTSQTGLDVSILGSLHPRLLGFAITKLWPKVLLRHHRHHPHRHHHPHHHLLHFVLSDHLLIIMSFTLMKIVPVGRLLLRWQ